ncbi:hypothetical protein SSP35_21_00570 [Streptomyces sp. NBRC 110611]|uniref:hypothetical protein n=1 Tax=Streptomyces sp. NBRC 110611 TaxID=1621259 RepID=UPI000830AD59|nr:hypothetical protein [Streptomyces sp. NBRC 110611]GAU70662.1 hypothetical protein SSP35_21_00570 [Streptomyces sp. NBRC 110611]
MRELTGEAAAIAKQLGGTTLLRNHSGGFSPTTVQLHLISAENSAGDPSTALAAAKAVAPQSLPSTERRARYCTDIAATYGHWGRRDECIRSPSWPPSTTLPRRPAGDLRSSHWYPGYWSAGCWSPGGRLPNSADSPPASAS